MSSKSNPVDADSDSSSDDDSLLSPISTKKRKVVNDQTKASKNNKNTPDKSNSRASSNPPNDQTPGDGDKGPTQIAFEAGVGGMMQGRTLVAMGYPRFVLPDKLVADAKMKKIYCFNKKALAVEVMRRAAMRGEVTSCTSKPIPFLTDKLDKDPIADSRCIAFLKAEFKKVETMLKNKLEDEKKEKPIKSNDAWVGSKCWLMLFEVMIHDSVIDAYRKSGQWSGRLEIDGRNSDEKPPEWQDLAAQLYNSPDFEPTTKAYKDLHEDFEEPIKIYRGDVPAVTPQKLKEQLMKVRAQMLTVITNWENSGNGSGQKREEGEENFGHIDDPAEQFVEGDNRKSFLDLLGFKSYVLYGWQLFDSNELLHRTLARLNNDGDIAHGISKTSGRVSPKPTTTEATAALTEIGRGVLAISKAFQSKENRALARELRALRKEIAATDDEEEKKELQEQYQIMRKAWASSQQN